MKGISIKSQEEIELMREAGRILAITHEEMRKALKPGMTTYDIDKLGEEVIRSYHCEPSFLNYQGYPASVCVSVNDEVVHGIPSKNRVLQDGDIVSLDAGVIYKGYHSDSARTYGVGEISDMAKYLIEATKQSFLNWLPSTPASIFSDFPSSRSRISPWRCCMRKAILKRRSSCLRFRASSTLF